MQINSSIVRDGLTSVDLLSAFQCSKFQSPRLGVPSVEPVVSVVVQSDELNHEHVEPKSLADAWFNAWQSKGIKSMHIECAMAYDTLMPVCDEAGLNTDHADFLSATRVSLMAKCARACLANVDVKSFDNIMGDARVQREAKLQDEQNLPPYRVMADIAKAVASSDQWGNGEVRGEELVGSLSGAWQTEFDKLYAPGSTPYYCGIQRESSSRVFMASGLSSVDLDFSLAVTNAI